MKKLMLSLAVLAVVSLSFISFTKSKTPAKSEEQVSYIWIRYGCQSYGASSPIYPSVGQNYYETSNPGMLQGNCPDPGTGVCAVRFLRTEVTCTPGANGMATPNPGVNPWDGNHMIKNCPN